MKGEAKVMRITAVSRAVRLAGAAVLVGVLATAGVGTARADYTTWNRNANCNNWHPHAWSDYTWSGGPSNANATTSAYLKEWINGQYVLQKSGQGSGGPGSSGSSNADAYVSNGEYGTGTWQSEEFYFYYYASVLQGGSQEYDYPNCG